MSYDKSWGLLGKPPASVLNGTHENMALFKKYKEEASRIQRMANGKAKTVAAAELRAKFNRGFPPE